MSIYHDAEERYRRDPAYKAAVQTMKSWIYEMYLTPGEIRDAAMLAAVHFEIERIPTAFALDRERKP